MSAGGGPHGAVSLTRLPCPLARNGLEVHVARLADLAPCANALAMALSPEECMRARSFRVARARLEFVIARGLLRRLLGDRLGLPPERVPLHMGPRGRPVLACEGGAPRFSVSHAGGRILLAFCPDAPVGVDVEPVTGALAGSAGSRTRAMSEREHRELLRLPPHARGRAWLRIWTRKEALAKGLGLGLALPFHAVHVGTSAGIARRRVRAGGYDARTWHVQGLALGHAHVGAVAVPTEVA